MIVVVIGGSGSGKSAYAEKCLLAMEAEKKHYIATMRVFDEEGEKRVEKHRTMRREKGFLTIEIFRFEVKNNELRGRLCRLLNSLFLKKLIL